VVVSRPFNLGVDDLATGSLVGVNLVSAALPHRVVRVDKSGNVTPFVVDFGASVGIAVDGTGRVLLVMPTFLEDPPTLFAIRPDGTRLRVSVGPLLREPVRLRRFDAGSVVVTDRMAGGVGPGLIRIRLSDGKQELLSSGGVLRSPIDLVVVPAP
jgi:hypothetical protein